MGFVKLLCSSSTHKALSCPSSHEEKQRLCFPPVLVDLQFRRGTPLWSARGPCCRPTRQTQCHRSPARTLLVDHTGSPKAAQGLIAIVVVPKIQAQWMT